MSGRRHGEATKIPGPGVILFSPTQNPICHDERAEELCRKLQNGRRSISNGSFKVPRVFSRYCSELVKKLRTLPHLDDCKHFKIRRILHRDDLQLLVNGFGFPKVASKGRPLVLLVVQEVEHQALLTTYHAKQHFMLTDREASVLHHLLKGWTNKEIAEALHITEQCVKQHIKHLMQKTSSSTRTQVILSVLSAHNNHS